MTVNQARTAHFNEVAEWLVDDPEEGLNEAEVKPRHQQYGEHRLRSAEIISIWTILVDQFIVTEL